MYKYRGSRIINIRKIVSIASIIKGMRNTKILSTIHYDLYDLYLLLFLDSPIIYIFI